MPGLSRHPASGKPSRGSARTLDLWLDFTAQSLSWSNTLYARGGVQAAANAVPASANGIGAVRNGRRANVMVEGGSVIIPYAVPLTSQLASSSGFRNDERYALVGYRFVIAVNDSSLFKSVTSDQGVLFYLADGRSSSAYTPLTSRIRTDGAFGGRVGFGFNLVSGAWRFEIRQNTSDFGNSGEPAVSFEVPWPASDLKEYVNVDFYFRQATDTKYASVEVELNEKLWRRFDWSPGFILPDPSAVQGENPSGTPYGFLPIVQNSDDGTDGHELWLAGLHIIAGPDEDGVRF